MWKVPSCTMGKPKPKLGGWFSLYINFFSKAMVQRTFSNPRLGLVQMQRVLSEAGCREARAEKGVEESCAEAATRKKRSAIWWPIGGSTSPELHSLNIPATINTKGVKGLKSYSKKFQGKGNSNCFYLQVPKTPHTKLKNVVLVSSRDLPSDNFRRFWIKQLFRSTKYRRWVYVIIHFQYPVEN